MTPTPYPGNDCVITKQNRCPCIEFVTGEGQRHGFHASHLLSYRLESKAGEPPQTLTLAFSTADVTLTGWRLTRIADAIRDGELVSVRPSGPKPHAAASFMTRYGFNDSDDPFIASIAVRPT